MPLRQLDILLYPPAINIILLALALVLWRRRTIALSLIILSTVTLLAFSLQITSHRLALLLERYPPLSAEQLKHTNADAIVVLGGGMVPYAGEYETSSLADDALMRLRYAAFLQKQTGLPLLASGAGYYETSEAQTMKDILTSDFNIANVMVEGTSRTTYENAANSTKILREQNMSRIFLVTSSLHMNRSVFLFKQQGLEVTPAPTDLYSDHHVDWRYYLPTGDSLKDARQVLHEYLALVWYWLKF
jgi:uncharacterized SAM-binding protein YcdF (DUF218 family)